MIQLDRKPYLFFVNTN